MHEMMPYLRAARGLEPADLVLKGGRIVNVFNGEVEAADLAICGERIVGIGRYEGREEMDVSGRFLTPGFIDPHLHVESTMVTPAELANVILPRGTTTIVADPHEIGNVLGIKGIRYLMEISRGLPLDIYFMAPSCVPSTNLETAGANLSAEDLIPLMEEPELLGLAEVMNFPGVLEGDPGVWEKLSAFRDKVIDGHAPLLVGSDLCGYVLPGIDTEHEASEAAEAAEKIARGMRVFIREGSQARNLAGLLPAVTEGNFRRVSFCTDDRHPQDLIRDGHVDHILRKAVSMGLDPVRAVTMATLNPAETYRFRDTGALAPGYRADVAVLKGLESFEVERVIKNGRLAALNGEMIEPLAAPTLPDWVGPMNVRDFEPDDLKVRGEGRKVRVIDMQPGQLLTGHILAEAPLRDGYLKADPDRDLVRLLVVERHRNSGNIGQGLVRGLGLKKGAIASSVAHDAHNIVAAGLEESDIAAAVKAVVDMRGGLAVVDSGRVVARCPLPLAGLMSAESARRAARDHEEVDAAAKALGCEIDAPFMALAFLALPVIPRLKLTDLGLVDGDAFKIVPLFVD